VADSVLAMLTNPLPILPDVDRDDWHQLPPDDIIAQSVNHFRTQRCGFVQTCAQYELLYDVVLLKLGDLYASKDEVKWPTLKN
jgi:protein tyrosine phosphatase